MEPDQVTPPITVTIPLLNPNEPEALLATLYVSEGQQVAEGDILCTLETTKSAADLEAESDGFVVALQFEQGQTVRAGEILCYLAGESSWTPPPTETLSKEKLSRMPPGQGQVPPEGLRITQPALALAQQNNLDLALLPLDSLVTESVVRAHLEKGASQPDFAAPDSSFDPTAIIIYGGGGHGKALVDLLQALGTYRVIGIVDDGLTPEEMVLGIPVLGDASILPDLYNQGIRLAVNAVGGIGNLTIRMSVFQKLAGAGFGCPAIVHPTAFIEASASLAPGVQIFPHAYIGSQAQISFGCIVNTGAIVSHECNLGVCANISPGAILAGEVQVGEGALVGMGVTINLQASIGAGARIGNGATVKGDVPKKGIVRAGSVWPD